MRQKVGRSYMRNMMRYTHRTRTELFIQETRRTNSASSLHVDKEAGLKMTNLNIILDITSRL